MSVNSAKRMMLDSTSHRTNLSAYGLLQNHRVNRPLPGIEWKKQSGKSDTTVRLQCFRWVDSSTPQSNFARNGDPVIFRWAELEHHMSHLQLLSEHFGGALLVRPVAAGSVINMAKPSVYNRVSAGTFPIPLVETAVGRMVRVTDIAAYLDSLALIMPIKAESEPKPKGRPTKEEQIEAKRRHMTVPELRAQRSLAGV